MIELLKKVNSENVFNTIIILLMLFFVLYTLNDIKNYLLKYWFGCFKNRKNYKNYLKRRQNYYKFLKKNKKKYNDNERSTYYEICVKVAAVYTFTISLLGFISTAFIKKGHIVLFLCFLFVMMALVILEKILKNFYLNNKLLACSWVILESIVCVFIAFFVSSGKLATLISMTVIYKIIAFIIVYSVIVYLIDEIKKYGGILNFLKQMFWILSVSVFFYFIIASINKESFGIFTISISFITLIINSDTIISLSGRNIESVSEVKQQQITYKLNWGKLIFFDILISIAIVKLSDLSNFMIDFEIAKEIEQYKYVPLVQIVATIVLALIFGLIFNIALDKIKKKFLDGTKKIF